MKEDNENPLHADTEYKRILTTTTESQKEK